MCVYSKYDSVLEIKPYDKFSYPQGIYNVYTYFLKGQTIYKAYLVSFSIVYKLLHFFSEKKEKNYTLYTTLKGIIFIIKRLLWLIVRVITSLPRTVIVDSYLCSRYF